MSTSIVIDQNLRTASAIEHKAVVEALFEKDLTMSDAFDRGPYGNCRRTARSMKARLVVWSCLAIRGKFSCSEIAAITGTNHSSILTAFKRVGITYINNRWAQT